ncbi:HTH-type transcriptional activator Btr [compost metagenome]
MKKSAVGFEHTPLFLLSSIHRRRHLNDKPNRFRNIPTAFLCLVTQGTGLLHMDQARYDIKSNQLYMGASGASLTIEPQSGPLEYTVILMHQVGIDKQDGNWRVTTNPVTSHPILPGKIGLIQTSKVLEKMDKLYDAYNLPEPNLFSLNGQFQELLFYITQHVGDMHEGIEVPETVRGIECSIDYMHKHFHDKIKLEKLAEMAGFTPTSYSREFKKITSSSPIDYLNALRIAKAKQLLLAKAHSVKEVSASSGFGDEFYFSRMFKREVGISPTLYMRRKDIRIAVACSIPFQDNLQSLGSSPVFAMNCLRHRTMNAEEYREFLEHAWLQMKQAEPELIICDHYHLPFMEQLKEIAPTVSLGLSTDWRVVHRNLADFVGLEEEAQRNFKQVDQYQMKAKELLSHRYGDETVAIIRIINNLIRIQGTINHPLNDLIYSELGLKPGYCVPENQMRAELPSEGYTYLDCDHLFILNFIYPGDEDVFKNIQGSSGWHSIRAVNNQHTHYVPNWVGLSWSPDGRIKIMEELLKSTL